MPTAMEPGNRRAGMYLVIGASRPLPTWMTHSLAPGSQSGQGLESSGSGSLGLALVYTEWIPVGPDYSGLCSHTAWIQIPALPLTKMAHPLTSLGLAFPIREKRVTAVPAA